jgi:hypothetical protein
MPVRVVRVALVVNLELKRVLQEVARLLDSQAAHDGRPFTDVYDLELVDLGQHAGNMVYVFSGRHPMSARAQFKLAERADVTEFADARS